VGCDLVDRKPTIPGVGRAVWSRHESTIVAESRDGGYRVPDLSIRQTHHCLKANPIEFNYGLRGRIPLDGIKGTRITRLRHATSLRDGGISVMLRAGDTPDRAYAANRSFQRSRARVVPATDPSRYSVL
jgi:hypothetical protein